MWLLLLLVVCGICWWIRSKGTQDSRQSNLPDARIADSWFGGTRRVLDKRSTLAQGNFGQVAVISDAISSNYALTFYYTKHNGQGGQRIVTPHGLYEYTTRATGAVSICMEGFCHVRGAERVFNIARMDNLKRNG